VAAICRRLDGIALAIELAAGQVASYGIEGTAKLLDDGLSTQWRGRRTASPRHQTIQAMLDWGYALLSDSERFVLQRASIMAGTFTMEAAVAVCDGGPMGAGQVVQGLGALVAKSLVSTTIMGDGSLRYRLLETTRRFVAQKLNQGGDGAFTVQRCPAHSGSPRRDENSLSLDQHADESRGPPASRAFRRDLPATHPQDRVNAVHLALLRS
jgi:predicted ATPase